MTASLLIRRARAGAGITQQELAKRAGVPQSTIARLEAPGSNPRAATLSRVLSAAGAKLDVSPTGGVDETLVVRNLRLRPAERLDRFSSAYRNVRELKAKAKRRGADLA